MKRVLVLGLVLACGAALYAAEAGDTMAAAVFDKWLTAQTVAFDNLKYGGTYTVLVFWNQGMSETDTTEGTTTTTTTTAPCPKGPPRTRQ